jgi:transcriptional regulator with XRE-family HTH domain
MNPLKTIRQIRREKNLKQVDLANQLEISQSNYAKLESGKIELTIKKLQQISDALGVHPADILFPGMLSNQKEVKEDKLHIEKLEKVYIELIESKNKLIEELTERSGLYKKLYEENKK